MRQPSECAPLKRTTALVAVMAGLLHALSPAAAADVAAETAQQSLGRATELREQVNAGAAREILERLLVRCREERDRRCEGRVLNEIGVGRYDSGDVKGALEYFEQALPARRAGGDRKGEGETLSNIGHVYADLGEKKRALEYYEQALPIRRAVGDRAGEATTLNNIGVVYSHLGKKKRALEYYEQALPIWRAVGNREGETATLNNIGAVYSALGEKKRALDYYEQVLPIRRAIGDRKGEATTLNNIGSVYDDLGEKQRALEYYEHALPISRDVGDRKGEATILSNIGGVYSALGKNERAMVYYKQAFIIQRDIGDRFGQANTLINVGQIALDIGENQLALKAFETILPVLRALGDRDREATTLNSIGVVYSRLGEKKRVPEYFEQALPIMRAVGDRAGEAKTLDNLMVALTEDSPRLAVLYGKQAVNVYQSLRGDIRGLDKEVQRTYVRSVSGSYRDLADLLASQGRLAEAQEVLALLKEEELDHLVPRRSGKPEGRLSLTPAEAEALRQSEEVQRPLTAVAAEYAALWRVSQRTPEQEQRLAALEKQMEAGKAQFHAFLGRLKEEFGPVRGREEERAIRENAGLMRTLRELGPGTVAVYTLVGEKKLRMILVTPELQRGYEAPLSAAELGRKVLALREGLQTPGRDPRAAAKELYDAIVAPMAADLEGAKAVTIMWSLDGVLRYVPMAALYDGEKWLVERYRNTVMTPASAGRITAAGRGSWTALGLGVTKPHEDLKALPGVRDELQTVVREKKDRAGVLSGQRLLDEAFTRKGMMDGLSTRPAVVHVASHYVFKAAGTGGEDASYLLLGDGTHFTLRDFDAMPPAALEEVDLLALSACETAMGRGDGEDLAGAEVDGLGMLAQQKGAAAVLATLWQVSDASTPALMKEFYRRRQEKPKEGKAAALQAAQLTLLRGATGKGKGAGRGLEAEGTSGSGETMPGWSHPYHWAPFILIGNWR